jgi:hypothetical protein
MINEKHNFFKAALDFVKTRKDRQYLERIFGVICSYYIKDLNSYFGDILKYQPWNYSYDSYLFYKFLNQLPIIKVWTGR